MTQRVATYVRQGPESVARRARRAAFAIAAVVLCVLATRRGLAQEAEPTPPAGGTRRVVSLVPSVTETIFALGAGDRLVGVSSFCDRPAEAARLPRAGSYLAPNVEAIVALAPDAVIGVPTPGNRAAVEQLRSLGVNVVVVGETTLADAWQAIRIIGDWVGRTSQARQMVARLEGELADTRRLSGAERRRRVLFVVGHDPLVAAGSGLFIDELIDVAGGENAAAAAGQRWPRLSLEAALAMAPEVIIDGAMGSEGGEAVAAYWGRYPSLPAVRDGRVRAQSSDALLRPGPRLGAAARELHALIWGDGDRARDASRVR